MLSGCQVLRVEDRRTRTLSRLKNQCVPKGCLVTRLEIECLEHSLGGIDYDFPGKIVTNEKTYFRQGKWTTDLSAKVDAQFLQYLGTQYPTT